MKAIGAGMALLALGFMMFLLMPIIMPQAQDMLTTTQTQSFTNVSTTDSGTVTLTLTDPAYESRLTSITNITSSVSMDNPVVTAVSADGKTLTVAGLTPSTLRTLTVAYLVDATADFVGLNVLVRTMPTIIMIAGLGIGIVGVWQAASGRRS